MKDGVVGKLGHHEYEEMVENIVREKQGEDSL